MSFTDSALWKSVLAGDDPYGRAKQALVSQLTTRDIDSLIAFVEDGSEKERQAAYSMFVSMRSQLGSDARLSQASRERLRGVLLQHVRANYPLVPASASTFLILRFLDPQSAADYLANELQLDGAWPIEIINRVFGDMLTGDKRSVARLQQASSENGVLGGRATFYLEMGGHISATTLQQLGREFKETKAAKALNRLYSSYISRQLQQPIEPILQLLGTPSRVGKGAYVYDAEGIQLFLEEDDQGRLTGARIK